MTSQNENGVASRLGIQIQNMKMVLTFIALGVGFEKLMMKIYDIFNQLSFSHPV